MNATHLPVIIILVFSLPNFFKKNSPNLIVIFGDLSSKHSDKYYLCCMLCWFGTKRCSQVRQVFTNSAAVNMISKPQGKARENNGTHDV